MQKFLIISFSILVVLFLLFIIITYIANFLFMQKTNQEIDRFLEQIEPLASESPVITTEMTEHLPEPVIRWLERANVIDQEPIISMRSRQTAVMRLSPEKRWMNLTADQYISTIEPGFIWRAKVNAAPLFHFVGRDQYYQGKGNMLIKMQSLFPIANSTGPEINQGSLVRYLAEIVWIPSATLHDYITWEAINSSSAKATMSYEGVTASGFFTFNEAGDPISFIADRYGDFNGELLMKPWQINMDAHKELGGYRIPTKGEVTWKLDDGDFTWYQFEVKQVEFNKPVRY